MIIGVTGNSGSGKSYILSHIDLPYKSYIIDADKIGHKILTLDVCKKEVVSCFGDNILQDEEISRKALGEIVFNNKEELAKLTKITHKYIIKNILDTIQTKKENYDIIFIDAALLIESGLNNHCDYNILVTSSFDDKLKRIVKRDNITQELAVARLQKQTLEETLKENCDFVVHNNIKEDVIEIFESVIKNILENGVNK